MKKAQQGFTPINLMIVVVIVGILAAAAIPVYQNYSRAVAYSEFFAVASPFKLAVEKCFAKNGNSLSNCTAGTNGVPAVPTPQTVGVFNSLTLTDGVIVLTPNAYKGISNTDTCVLTPVADSHNVLHWTYSSVCADGHYVKN